MDDLINNAHPAADQPRVVDQNASSTRCKQPVVSVIAGGPTMAENSNRSKKNYLRSAMISKEVFFNTPTTKWAKTM